MKNSIYGWAVLAFAVAMLGLYAANVPTGGGGSGGSATNAQPPNAKLTNLSAITATDKLLGINSAGRVTNSANASLTNVNAFFTNIVRLTPIDAPNLKAVVEAQTGRTAVELGIGVFIFPSNQITFPEGVWLVGQGPELTTVMCPWAVRIEDLGDGAPQSGSFNQFIWTANNGMAHLTLDGSMRRKRNYYQQMLGEVAGTMDPTNMWCIDVQFKSWADCFVYAQLLPIDWHFEGCKFSSGIAGVSSQTGGFTNCNYYFSNCEWSWFNDQSEYAPVPSGTMLSIQGGFAHLRNCSFRSFGITNMYKISEGTTTGTTTVFIATCTFGSFTPHGDDYDLYNQSPNVHHYVDNPQSVDFSKIFGPWELWPGHEAAMAHRIWLDGGFLEEDVNLVSGLFFAPGGPTNSASQVVWGVMNGPTPEGVVPSCPGGLITTTNAAGTNTLVWSKATGCGNTGWISLGAAGSAGGGGSGNTPPYTVPITGTNFVIDWVALGSTNSVYLTNYAAAGLINTNVVDGKVIRVTLRQGDQGFNTIVQNTNSASVGGAGPNFRTTQVQTGITQSTNGGYEDFILLYGSRTNAVLSGQNWGAAP